MKVKINHPDGRVIEVETRDGEVIDWTPFVQPAIVCRPVYVPFVQPAAVPVPPWVITHGVSHE